MTKSDRGIVTAYRLRRELEIPIHAYADLNKIASRLSIKIEHHDLGEGIEGACKSDGLYRFIVLKRNLESTKERFTLAHEIGHLLIHHASFLCDTDVLSMFRTHNSDEQEANDFAAELLIPSRACINILEKADLEISVIKQVAEQFGTSLAVASIKLTQLFSDNAVVLWHDGKKVKWRVKSDSCYFRISDVVPDTSLAHRTSDGERIIKDHVDPEMWIDKEVENLICEEETIFFTVLKEYLTILKFYFSD